MKIKMFKSLSILLIAALLSACGQSNNNSTEPNNPPQESPIQTDNGIVQEPAGWLFTANEGGSISKIDLSSNKVTATIEADGSIHNVQLSPDGTILAATIVPEMNEEDAGHTEEGGEDHGHGMVMNGIANFYDAESGNLIKTVEVGAHPAHVVFTNDGSRALVTNNEDNNVTVIDTNTYSIINTIQTGTGPHGFRISADDKFAYIANMGEDTVSVIDLSDWKEIKRIQVGAAPVTTSVTTDGKLLAVTLNAENALALVDLATGEVTKIEVGVGPAQVFVQPDNKFAYVANQGTEKNPSRTVSIIDIASKKVTATIETGDGAHGLITSPDLTKLYVTNMYENTLSVINTESNQVIATVQTGETPNGVTVTP